MEKSSGNDSRDLAVGCGPALVATPQITLNITTTTGGTFKVLVDSQIAVEYLKKIIAKKLKVSKERICLLHRERELIEGSLKDNGLTDESKIILIPNVETGLLAQRPENTVMQALESLNDAQVHDFLCGKTPLNLSMRLGDHMMLIQLQLSTVSANSPLHVNRSTRNSFKSKLASTFASSASTQDVASTSTSTGGSSSTLTTNSIANDLNTSTTVANRSRSVSIDQDENSTTQTIPSSSSSPTHSTTERQRDLVLTSKEFEDLKSIVNSLQTFKQNDGTDAIMEEVGTPNNGDEEEQSPIKSLSNLVSSPIKSSIPPKTLFSNLPSTSTANSNTDPITAKLTSCLCKRLDSNSNSNSGCELNCQLRQEPQPSTSATAASLPFSQPYIASTSSQSMKSIKSSLLHRTINTSISKLKHRNSNSLILRRSKSTDNIHDIMTNAHTSSGISRTNTNRPKVVKPIPPKANEIEPPLSAASSPRTTLAIGQQMEAILNSDTNGLAEASRNLTQTLRKLSKEVFTNKKVEIRKERKPAPSNGCGAVIESMKNHGKGIYSGTFSGTLNPALQDRYGQPKRDISTVIHILNDLLSATPQYGRGARFCIEPNTTTNIRIVPRAAPTTSNTLTTPTATTSKTTYTATKVSSGKCSRCSTKCIYGQCVGHNNEVYYCDKHKPPIDTVSASTSATALMKPTSCRCARSATTTTTTSTVRMDESSNDSLNSSECQCQFRSFDPTVPEDGPPLHTKFTPVCVKCNSIELENNKTKSTVEKLRLVMKQKKERREARKLKQSPYSSVEARVINSCGANSLQAISVGGNSTLTSTIETTEGTVDPAAVGSPQSSATHNCVEEVDTAA